VTQPSVLRPVLYIGILLASIVGTYVVKLRTAGIFGCTAEGYYASTNAYLGFCNASAYGDYDHGAFWFDLEPEARRFAANAAVLFVGSSRMQFAFSSIATDKWFAAAAVPHYLMGFTHTENSTFVAPLLQRLEPHAKVYVINVDQFFLGTETGPASQILHDGDIERRYREKRLWQIAHRALCTRAHAICGHQFAYYRSRQYGHWKAFGNNKPDTSFVSEDPASDEDKWDHYAELARQFIADLPVDRSCVVLTNVPSPNTRSAEAKAIAEAVGLPLVNPQLEGLRTFDGSHLDRPSAERWSAAFFETAGPQIQRCLTLDASQRP
jgi:hypothetical protein